MECRVVGNWNGRVGRAMFHVEHCGESDKRQSTPSTHSARTAVWIGCPPPSSEEWSLLSRPVPVNVSYPATMIVCIQRRCCSLRG